MEQEKKYLEYAKKEIGSLIVYEEDRFKRLPTTYKDDPFLLQELMSKVSIKIRNLHTSKDKPYFARIDFKEHDTDLKKIYIGKVGVISNDSEIVVVDWRAPVSTMYYDSNIGHAEYVAPDGRIQGELKLKRQIVIEKGELISIYDVDSVSDDEMLKPYLGVNADSRLKNIVASIQKEQNEIIRAPIYKNLIVQGVAGSGKTTVALHRIAFLIYNMSGSNKEDQFMVIGPNKFFINYISSVLPDLDVINVKQLTFEELAQEYINEKFEINNNSKKALENIDHTTDRVISKIKTSMIYMKAIDKFLSDFEEKFFDNNPYMIKDFTMINGTKMKNIYNDNEIELSITSKVERAIKVTNNKILKNEIALRKKISDVYGERNNELKWDIITEITAGGLTSLKKYFKPFDVKIMSMYKQFITDIEKYIDLNCLDKFKADTLKNINKRSLDVEDIPALMYLKYKFSGEGIYKKYVHAVVDESQDFGEFHFYILSKLMSKSTFTIFGDLAQSIYSYRGIDNWNQVMDAMNNNSGLMKLEKSYRTTIEIMEAASDVTEYIGMGRGLPVIRHGKDVEYVKVSNHEKYNFVKEKIQAAIDNKYKSIAVICKTVSEVEKYYDHCKQHIESVEKISQNDEMYNGGICILTAQLAKGLEFDVAIIVEADEHIYSSSNDIDMKLLYVAMTRALHEVKITYTNTITTPLVKNIK